MDPPDHINDLTDDEEFAELLHVIVGRRRNFRPRVDHFVKWNDYEFKQRFRLSKSVVKFLVNKIRHEITPRTNRNHAVTAEQMVFATLRFLATGSMLYVIGDFNGIDKSAASRVITRVIDKIARLYGEYIEMPNTPEEIQNVRQGFYNIARMPRCIGALDCTHVKIRSPGGNNAEMYRNRKDFFSYNVQALCDANLILRDVVCRWPGSSHDATIFRNSRLRAHLEAGLYGADSIVVGDSGYPLRNYLVTPLAHPANPPEQLYNESQIRTRNPIERCFGVWKRRFPILALGIRLRTMKVEGIVIATAVLHNKARHMGDEVPTVNAELEAHIEVTNNVNMYGDGERNVLHENNITRHILIDEHYRRLARLNE